MYDFCHVAELSLNTRVFDTCHTRSNAKSQRFDFLKKNHERTNSKLFALGFPCVGFRSKPCCNTQKHHQMAPLGKSCFASWFPSSDVYSKHSLVKCLWKREENLLWGRKNTNDKTALALAWIWVYRVKL